MGTVLAGGLKEFVGHVVEPCRVAASWAAATSIRRITGREASRRLVELVVLVKPEMV